MVRLIMTMTDKDRWKEGPGIDRLIRRGEGKKRMDERRLEDSSRTQICSLCLFHFMTMHCEQCDSFASDSADPHSTFVYPYDESQWDGEETDG